MTQSLLRLNLIMIFLRSKTGLGEWLVTINPTKTECMTFSVKRMKPLHPDIFCSDKKIIEVSQHTHLCVVLSNNFSWRAHIFKIYDKASKRLNILKDIKYKVDKTTLRKSLHIFVESFNGIRRCIMGWMY